MAVSPLARESARAHAHEAYLAALLAPREVRDDLIVLAAANGEIARIPFQVREPMMGEIRLQWWRDVLAGERAVEAAGHPVAGELAGLIARRADLARPLLAMLDAMSVEVQREPIPDAPALARHLRAVDGSRLEAAARICGLQAGAHEALLQAAGEALGLVRVLRQLPADLARGGMLLPVAEAEAVGATPDDFTRTPAPEAITRLVAALAGRARGRLADARPLLTALPRNQRIALLPLALIEPYLAALEGEGHDPLRHEAQIAPLVRVWRLWSAKLRGAP